MTRHCITLAILTSVVTLQAAEPPAEHESQVERIILPLEQFNNFSKSPLGDDVDGYWTPDAQTIHDLESKLRDFLLAERRREPADSIQHEQLTTVLNRLQTQRRQYVGFTRRGRRFVHLNVLPPEIGPDDHPEWKSKYVFVWDGGPSYWDIDFEPATKKFSSLFIHTSP